VRTLKTSGHLTTGKLGNQKIALGTPSFSACTNRHKLLTVELSSSVVRSSHRAKLHFLKAAFFIDKGSHRRAPNAVVRHLPATLALRLTGLKSGSHALKVVVSFTEKTSRHGHPRTVVVSKTLRAKLRIC
jgi:hypothetical protein